MIDQESEGQKTRRKEFEKFSKEALAYFIVHEVAMFIRSEPLVERLAEIERDLTSDRLLARMQVVAAELQSAPLSRTHKERKRFFLLHEEFGLIQKRLDRIHRQRDAAWKRLQERWAAEKAEAAK